MINQISKIRRKEHSERSKSNPGLPLTAMLRSSPNVWKLQLRWTDNTKKKKKNPGCLRRETTNQLTPNAKKDTPPTIEFPLLEQTSIWILPRPSGEGILGLHSFRPRNHAIPVLTSGRPGGYQPCKPPPSIGRRESNLVGGRRRLPVVKPPPKLQGARGRVTSQDSHVRQWGLPGDRATGDSSGPSPGPPRSCRSRWIGRTVMEIGSRGVLLGNGNRYGLESPLFINTWPSSFI